MYIVYYKLNHFSSVATSRVFVERMAHRYVYKHIELRAVMRRGATSLASAASAA